MICANLCKANRIVLYSNDGILEVTLAKGDFLLYLGCEVRSSVGLTTHAFLYKSKYLTCTFSEITTYEDMIEYNLISNVRESVSL